MLGIRKKIGQNLVITLKTIQTGLFKLFKLWPVFADKIEITHFNEFKLFTQVCIFKLKY